jgi:hypothetical protein
MEMKIVKCYTPRIIRTDRETTRELKEVEFCGYICRVNGSETTERGWGITVIKSEAYRFSEQDKIEAAKEHLRGEGEDLTYEEEGVAT